LANIDEEAPLVLSPLLVVVGWLLVAVGLVVIVKQ